MTPVSPQISVVVPVYNEESSLAALFSGLYPTLDQLNTSYEILFVDDGGRDGSAALLREQFGRRPDTTRVVVLASNAGQHMAILAGLELARGNKVITIDADLQNPPEEIGKLVAAMDAGADYVGTIRRRRQDSWWRGATSRLMNRIRERTTHVRITDQGCMLRGYAREVVDAVNRCREVNTFIRALAYLYSRNPAEIVVAHAERAQGDSKYSLLKLIRLNFPARPRSQATAGHPGRGAAAAGALSHDQAGQCPGRQHLRHHRRFQRTHWRWRKPWCAPRDPELWRRRPDA